MQIDKTISSSCAVCQKNVELQEHYYGIGLVHKYSSYRLIVAPLYYNEELNEGYCSPQCSTAGHGRSSPSPVR